LNDIGELIIEFRNPTDNSMLFDIHKCKSDSNNADGHEMQRRPMRRATRSFEPERPKHFEMFKIKVYSKLGEDHGNCRYTLYRYINTAITPGD